MLNDLPDYEAPETTTQYHFVLNPGKANVAALEKVKIQKLRKGEKARLEPPWSRFISKKYLGKIIALARRRRIEVKFVFLPSYGDLETQPGDLEFYKKYGEVLLPPAAIFQSTEYRVDADHLNAEGASELTVWLAENL